MKTYKEVIDETVEYYKTNPFGYDEVTCKCVYYHPENGAMCAVGRCLLNPQNVANYSADRLFAYGENFNLLKEEYRHLNDLNFWSKLQEYHDYHAVGELDPDILENLYSNWGDK